MARRRDRFISEAAEQALVRYGPEISGLTALQRRAEENYALGIRQARGTARGITSAIDQVRPEVAKIYDRAGLDAARTAHTLIGQDLQGLGNVADSIKAGAALEAAGGVNRLTESRSDALTELGERRVQAQQGRQWAEQSAGNTLVGELSKILQRRQDLRREQGAFTSQTASQLREEARDRALRVRLEEMGNATTRRGQDLSAQQREADRESRERVARTRVRTERSGRKWATPVQQSAAHDTIGQALNEAKTLRQAGAKRSEVAAMLQAGAKEREVPLRDPRTGRPQINEDGTPKVKRIPGVPQIKSQLLLSVALDVLYDGHISRRNQDLLHRRGIKVRDLGFPTYGQWKRRQPGMPGSPVAGPPSPRR